MQCYKNIAVGGAGIAGGTVGAIYGGAIGTSICPGLGTVIGSFIGGMAGGAVSGAGTKAIADKFIQDDSVEIMKLVSEQIGIICFRFCLSDSELSEVLKNIDNMIASRNGFVEEIYSKGSLRRQYINRLIKPIFVRVAMKRPLLLADQISPEAIGNALADEGESAA